jgi:UDP-N-acetylmuramoyl-L-alanyl-D-glutamate--2,6-diaminopimelate ligase
MQLIDLFPHLTVKPAPGKPSLISGLSQDSRQIQPGWLFAALPGNKQDGHAYLEEALSRGATAVLSEKKTLSLPAGVIHIHAADSQKAFIEACAKFWRGRPQMAVAVTGTNGKTSVADYLHQLWDIAGWQSAALGTMGLRCAVAFPGSELRGLTGNLTTPPPEKFFAIMDMLGKAGVGRLAFEASSHGISQQRFSGLAVHIAVFTNLGRDHLDYHGSMEEYFASKARLFEENLLAGGIAIINIDDEWGQKLAVRLQDRQLAILTFGRAKTADFRIHLLQPESFGHLLEVTYQGERFSCPLALAGDFQATNALAAGIAAHASGLSLPCSLGRLAQLKPVAGRMQPVFGHPAGARVVIDYAHTADALAAALTALRSETPGQLQVLFGCGGERDIGKRALMGKAAARLADRVIITDDNPRGEDPAAIRAEIKKACKNAEEITPRDAAIQKAVAGLASQDTLLIAGKGHETVQMIGTETLPFDDAVVARNAIAALPARRSA